MHMADSLLSPTVGLTMYAVSAVAIAYSAVKVKKEELCEKRVPLVCAMGAFVFAAQMLNFAIPGTGSSGHITGGILLAAVLGSYPAMLAMSAILVVQCLFFADGGLLALGCNIFNLGVIPCLIVYPLVYKPLAKQGSASSIALASAVAVIAGLQLGAFGVVLQTFISGVAELPFAAFISLMLPIHFAIGLAEGIITAAALCSVYKIGIEKPSVAMLAVLTLIVGGLSVFASSNPDGLEWSIENAAKAAESVRN